MLNPIAGVTAVAALLAGMVIAPKRQRIVALVLTTIGVTAFVTALSLGYEPTLATLGRFNQDFISMLACVTFLALITPKEPESRSRLRGVPAIVRTGFVIHLIGSVINILAVGLAAEKLRKGAPLKIADASLISKTFMMASIWTPFWVAVAAAASYVPGADFLVYTSIGFGAAMLIVLLFSLDNVRMRTKEELAEFEGYALSWSSMKVPLVLILLIAGLHFVAPEIPVARLVVVSVLLVAFLGLLPTYKLGTIKKILLHGLNTLDGSKSETTVLVSAGVLTVGLLAIQEVTALRLPLTAFDVPAAWAFVVITVVFSMGGIHQFITLSIAAGLLIPLNPEPTLFVIAATLGWSLGSIVGPISGITNYLNGKYNIGNFQLVKANFPAAVIGVALAFPILLLINQFV